MGSLPEDGSYVHWHFGLIELIYGGTVRVMVEYGCTCLAMHCALYVVPHPLETLRHVGGGATRIEKDLRSLRPPDFLDVDSTGGQTRTPNRF